ncbi:HNH endonuclease [Bacillus wiedmannii]|uniref:HNH endonuclease n=1 Tax=Bacillus wiedmannii TaxID=1890302 RepID=UPI001482D3E6|nr:HNH endonuclease [Bacillus wiedmannii]
MSRKKFCSCGKIVPDNEVCSCKQKQNRNQYQREYYEKNKDILKPLSSTRWRKLRSLIIKRDKGCCQRCLIKFRLINGDQLQVHHIKPRIEFPELMFDETNLITVCKTCNLQIGLKELDFEPTIDLNNIDYDFKL